MTIFGEHVRWRVILFVLAMVLAAFLIYRVADFFRHMGPSYGEVESWIRTELPPHASEAQVYAMFDGHGLTYQIDRRNDAQGRNLVIVIGERLLDVARDCTLMVRFDFGSDGLVTVHETSEQCISL